MPRSLKKKDFVEFRTFDGNIYRGYINECSAQDGPRLRRRLLTQNNLDRNKCLITITYKNIVDSTYGEYDIGSQVRIYTHQLEKIYPEPSENNKKIKKQMMDELKTLPPMPEEGPYIFPGGIDFQKVRNKWNNNLERREVKKNNKSKLSRKTRKN